MAPGRIPDLSSLWTNRENRFILRFHNISDEMKRILATRIKETSPIRTLRTKESVTVDVILNTLMQINPIIFAEHQRNYHSWITTDSPRCFGKSTVQAIEGWWFKILCTSIYKITCLKRELATHELTRIVQLTTTSEGAQDFLATTIRTNTTLGSIERPLPHDEVGLDEIEQARLRAEQAIARTGSRQTARETTYNQVWRQAQEELRREGAYVIGATDFTETQPEQSPVNQYGTRIMPIPDSFYTQIIVDDAGNNITQ